MVMVTTEFISGKNIETLGYVRGATVRSKNIGKDIGAGLKTLVGGELKGYTEMLDEARKEAIGRMVEEAESLGADGIIGLRFASSAIMQGAVEIVAYGTAVKFV